MGINSGFKGLRLPSPLPMDNTKALGNQKCNNALVKYRSNIYLELEKCLRVETRLRRVSIRL